MSKKKALGRGLSALLSDSPTDEKLDVDNFPISSHSHAVDSAPVSGMTEIPLEEIEVSRIKNDPCLLTFCKRPADAGDGIN